MPEENSNCWAIVDLMGHVELAGKITKPGEYGGLWQIDIPEGETFRTEFFGSQSVYRIRIVSESIARAYSNASHEVIEYAAPIITREEHENSMQRAREQYSRIVNENEQLKRKLLAIQALPAGDDAETDEDSPSF
jgi:hypothetical protein